MRFSVCPTCLPGSLVLAAVLGFSLANAQDIAIKAAQQARNRGAVNELGQMIQTAGSDAQHLHTFASYLRLALLGDYMCEAGADHHDNGTIKHAAQAGVAAAREAVRLNANSSEAHRLLGSLLGQLIPYATGGGMRYGPKATSEADRAIQLDPNNAAAYITRATDYWFTPRMFGGSKIKAVEMLKKAIATSPSSDAADTAYIRLATIDLNQKRTEDARRDINQALRLDPDRMWAQIVRKQVTSQ